MELESTLDKEHIKLLELFANEINNTKRIEECLILKTLLLSNTVQIEDIKSNIKTVYGYLVSNETIDSCINNLNFKFVTENKMDN
ncbi:MAG: DUF3427 domain-containing protein [Saprospiraceae bacterium]|nr:DUF3427 domain-containing protein [Candidatus Opimibacter skivensis]